MPNWRQNLLSAGESLSLTRDKKKKDPNVFYQSSSLSRLNNIQITTEQPEPIPRSRKSSQCVESATETVCSFQYESYGAKKNHFIESDVSAEFSSFLTDSSSFADYEDRRGSVSNLRDVFDELPPYDAQGSQLKIDRVPYTNSVFYVTTKSEFDAGLGIPASEVYFVDALPSVDKSDCLSTSSCDSFERCQFDGREFEPFSDTCCCDPNSEGGCTRSPKLLDSPVFCTSPIINQCIENEDDRLSNRSDMDGLDLALFEPAERCDQNDDMYCENGCSSEEKGASIPSGMLHILSTDTLVNDEVGPGADWQPHFCVLLQDRGILAAYRSEDMAALPWLFGFNDMGSSLPRVRVDAPGSGAGGGVSRGALRCWAAPSIAEEPAGIHDEDTISLQEHSMLGELKCLSLPHGTRPPGPLETLPSPPDSPARPLTHVLEDNDTSYEKACRRGSGGTPNPGTTPVASSPSRLAAFFFSKRSLRSSPLKRARSAAKLAPRTPLRSSRSHESLLSQPAACVAAVSGGTVRPLHASLAGGRAHCFLLHMPGPPPSTRYFACASRLERDTWINNLKASLQPDGGSSIRRTERSLRLYLLEAKGLPPKKRYYCELLLDATLYARTSSKLKTDLCFWGEVFEFPGLPHVNVITVDVYREPDRKPRKRDKRFLVGSVKIPVHELQGRYQSERWHGIINANSTANGDPNGEGIPPPTLRVKCRYQTLEVLPPHVYEPLLLYLRDNYTKLLEYLEPIIGVKGKEEVAGALVGTVRGAGGPAAAARLLAVAAALEVRRAPHAALAFRANSLATKATEAYMKMLGETYLQETLWECVSGAMSGGAGGVWEVDPARGAGAGAGLRRQRQRLRTAASRTWRAVRDSASRFPPDLRLAFAAFREKLRSMQREELADHIVSASVFLRFVCPAILSPSLFGITHEYPDERAARNLTLVAKTLQTLANFTRFQGKEAFMEFLNDFLEEEAPNMRQFLKEISTLPPGTEGTLHEEWGSGPGAGHLDLGKQLAALHLLLAESVPKLPPASLQELEPLPSILEKLTEQLQEQNLPQSDVAVHPQVVHDNIFRYNDPTYSPRSADSVIAHSSPLLNHTALQVNTISSTSSSLQEDSIAPPKYNTSLLNHLNIRKSPSLGVRAATLPRNNFANVGGTHQTNPDRYSSQYNNREHCVNHKVVQIGLEPKNASSPSLIRKVNGSNGSIQMHSLPRNEPINNRLNSEIYSGGKNIFIDNTNKNDDSRLGNSYENNSRNIYRPAKEQIQSKVIPTNLEDLSDLLRFADDHEHIENNDENIINQRISNHEIVPQTTINISNGNQLVNHNHIHNGGSNVSISALSNVASSGYQSFATYSQSSSPVELYQQNTTNFHESSPAHHGRRPGPLDRKNNINKNPYQHQRLEYERQKFGIQNFTTDTGSSSPRLVMAAPLTFKNPAYDDGRNDDMLPVIKDDSNSNLIRPPPKRSISTTSSSSIEEDDTTDNAETNSEGHGKNYKERTSKNNRRNIREGNKQKQDQRDLRHAKSNVDAQLHRRLVNKTRSNGSELSGKSLLSSASNNSDAVRDHKPLEYAEPIAPLRRTTNSKLPRTNPLLSYNSANPNQNVTHFGQNNGELQYQGNNNNDLIKGDGKILGNINRPDSNVEETNKEMYRLQMSRSQKAIYDRNNVESFSNSNIPRMLEKYDNNNIKNNNLEIYNPNLTSEASYDAMKNNYAKSDFDNNHAALRITKNGYPLERNFSKNNVSSTRLNEEMNFENNLEALEREREREGLERAVRRLSLEGVGDSTSEEEDVYYHTTGRRRMPKSHRAIHQYGREMERMKGSLDLIKKTLKTEAKTKEPSGDIGDSKMKGIITRLLDVEEELRKEQQAMAIALKKKQVVIEKQTQKIAALGAANTRLRTALHQLHPEIPSDALIQNFIPESEVFEPQENYNSPNNQGSQNLLIKASEPTLQNFDDNLSTNDLDLNQMHSSDKQGARINMRQPMYNIQKSPSHNFYQDKGLPLHNDGQANLIIRNSDKSSSNQHLDSRKMYKSDKSPNHQLDTHHQMYHDKGLIDLQNDEDLYAFGENKLNINRNSDPISPRHYVSQDYQRQNDSMAQFNQSERSLVPPDNHQAVISTQPAIYYSNS